ncbi:MAG: T9SS type A sorting domain-containing protein [candidate division WOR-3 bacterium]
MNRLLFILSLLLSLTYAQYQCDWYSVNSGGTRINIGNLSAQVSVSQTAVGIIQSTNQVAQIGFWIIDTTLVGIKEISIQKPSLKTELFPPRPNPFSQNTILSYSLAKESNVSINIYNTGGGLVKRFSFPEQKPGIYSFPLSSERMREGVYFLHFSADGYKKVKKIIFLR